MKRYVDEWLDYSGLYVYIYVNRVETLNLKGKQYNQKSCFKLAKRAPGSI